MGYLGNDQKKRIISLILVTVLAAVTGVKASLLWPVIEPVLF